MSLCGVFVWERRAGGEGCEGKQMRWVVGVCDGCLGREGSKMCLMDAMCVMDVPRFPGGRILEFSHYFRHAEFDGRRQRD